MFGFVDVLLRGAILVFASLVLGGVVWTRLVLGTAARVAPAPPATMALRLVAVAAGLAAVAQAATMLGALAEVRGAESWPLADFFQTTFALTALARVMLAAGVSVLALRLSRQAASPGAWRVLGGGAVLIVVSSAVLSHAIARVEDRAVLLALDAAHQAAAAVWIGGLAHLTLYAAFRGRATPRPRSVGARAAGPIEPAAHAVTDVDLDFVPSGPLAAPRATVDDAAIVRRFSRFAFASVLILVSAGVVLTWRYVGDWAGLVGTAYGVMVLSKAILLAAILGLAALNSRAVWPASAGLELPLRRFVEVELGLGITVLFAAASLTSLPPAVDVTTDRATVAEVAGRFVPAPPRLSSPPVADLIARAEPLLAPVTRREPIERAWSEYNHHWAGFFVLAMGLLAALERLGMRAARHWPLVLLGLAAFLFFRNDPRAWPLGPAGFWESLALPDVLQHRTFVVLIVAFAVFEWMVRTGRLAARPWGYVFPLLCAVGGGLLLTHSHAMFNLKDEFLTEVTHAPLGILGTLVGWGRWLELRLPGAGRGPGWLWTLCLIAIGLILLVYREA
jgi:putative copper resistance protein D